MGVPKIDVNMLLRGKSIPGAATVLVSKGNVFQFTKGDLSHPEMKSVTDSNGENVAFFQKKKITKNRRNPWQLAIVLRLE